MSNNQISTNKDECPNCNGTGREYVEDIPWNYVPCSLCKGSGKIKPNTNNLFRYILVGIILIGIGYLVYEVFKF